MTQNHPHTDAKIDFFEDGSRLDYYIQLDIFRYRTGEPVNRRVDVGLLLDQNSGRLRVDESETWRWRDPQVRYDVPSHSGPALSEEEKSDLRRRLRVFIANRPKSFEPLKEEPKNGD